MQIVAQQDVMGANSKYLSREWKAISVARLRPLASSFGQP